MQLLTSFRSGFTGNRDSCACSVLYQLAAALKSAHRSPYQRPPAMRIHKNLTC
jgi:hypothetical protein